MTIHFFLAKTDVPPDVLTKAQQLKGEIRKINQQIQDLGYCEDTAQEVADILSRRHGHPAFLEYEKHHERLILGLILNDWKPVYEDRREAYSNLSELRSWIAKHQGMSIFRSKNGEVLPVSYEEFVNEMQNTPYTKFGMPNRYDQKENTIWQDISPRDLR